MEHLDRKNNHRNLFSDDRGQSLIQVLVSIGIMGIMMMTLITAINYQQREVNSLSERLAITDFEKTLTAAMADGAVCKYVLNHPTVSTFNANLVSSTNPQVISLQNPLYGSVTQPGNLLGPVIAKIGEAPSAFSSKLKVSAIQLSIDTAPSPVPIATAVTFKANWIVGFDSTQLVRALKPASVSTILTVDTTNPTQSKITACQISGINNAYIPPPPGTLGAPCTGYNNSQGMMLGSHFGGLKCCVSGFWDFAHDGMFTHGGGMICN